MGDTRALTLCGAGGIGKTRLALRILAGVAEGFPDGVWFVELGDLRQPDLVVSRVASVIGIAEEPGRPLLDTVADALTFRSLLMVLDNCEHLIEACARVCQRLLAGSPGLRVLATSREPLRVDGERVWQVQPLSVAPDGVPAAAEDADRYEAVRLFADRAAASLSGFVISPANAPVVLALCRALDGIPLAIELAAARVRALSVEQIGARLVDRFGLLTTGSRTAPPRQQTLRAAIDWSYHLLTTPEQVLLRRLSVFAGWSLEMAEAVCSDDAIPAADMLDLITALVDKSLVVRDPEVLGQARYRLLDTIREYAAVCLAEAGESGTFRARLRDYTLDVAEENLRIGMALTPAPWSARVDVFRRFDVETGNLWQVLSHCVADTEVETGLRICNAVRPCWIVRGTFAEGAEWLDSFLGLDTAEVPPGVLGAALVGRAQLALSSDRTVAETKAEDGLELCRAGGDDFWTAAGLNLLAEIALHTGRIDAAASCSDEAVTIAQKSGDGWNEGYALGIEAAIAGVQGRLRDAQRLAMASISVMRGIDQQWGVARGLMGLGDLYRLRNDLQDAHDRYTEALAILRQIDARPEIARCLAGLGRVAMDLGAVGHARQHLTESLRISHATGSRIGVARGLEAFAALAVLEDRPEPAVKLTAAATALRDAAGLSALSGERAERYLASARRLGEATVAKLWAQGLGLSSDEAVALAFDAPPPAAPLHERDVTALTPREWQIALLISKGRRNKAIAEELVISPATVARHVANIMAKLDFSSRAQIAAWATADQQLNRGAGDESAQHA